MNIPPKPTRLRVKGARSVSRLWAIKAVFQIEQVQASAACVIEEFIQFRLSGEDEEIQYISPDIKFFSTLVSQAIENIAEIDKHIRCSLSVEWNFDRLSSVTRAILRVGTGELLADTLTPLPILISEYVDLALAFLEKPEVSFVNGVLDRIGQQMRTPILHPTKESF